MSIQGDANAVDDLDQVCNFAVFILQHQVEISSEKKWALEMHDSEATVTVWLISTLQIKMLQGRLSIEQAGTHKYLSNSV